MRKNHNSLESDRKRKTLRDTSLTCYNKEFGSKKSRLYLKCERSFTASVHITVYVKNVFHGVHRIRGNGYE